MSIQIGAAPESSFDNPLGLLSDCHRRIERFLRQLLAVTEHTNGGPLDDQARHALEVALRYFREAAPRHTRDEEDSLFPRLKESDDPEVREALSIMGTLEADHETADAAHAEVEQLGTEWLDKGELSTDKVDRLRELLMNLQSLYARHINIEDNILFPSAARILPHETITRVGREMAERRGIDLAGIPDFKLRCPTKRLM